MAEEKAKKPKGLLAEESNQTHVLAWLKKHWPQGSRVCPICGSRDWNLAEDIVALPRLLTDQMVDVGEVFPQVMLNCKACSYTMLFNATKMGLPLGPQKDEVDG